MVLLDNREVKKGWSALKDTINGFFKKHGAEILASKRWDERRLAYPIARQKRGTYLLIYFSGETLQTSAIRRELELSEQVMRHMILGCEEVPTNAYDAEAAFDESALTVDDEPEPPTSDPRAAESRTADGEREPQAGAAEPEKDKDRDKDRDKDKDK